MQAKAVSCYPGRFVVTCQRSIVLVVGLCGTRLSGQTDAQPKIDSRFSDKPPLYSELRFCTDARLWMKTPYFSVVDLDA